MSMSEDELLDVTDRMLDLVMNEGLPPALEESVEPAVVPDVPATPELVIDAAGRAHGPDGKFVSEKDSTEEEVSADAETEPEAEAEETQEEEEVEETVDEDLLELEIDPDHPIFSKYGGDVEKAFAALEDAQRLVGQRNHEVGTLRQENEQLQQVLAQLQGLEARLTPYQNDADENPQGLIQEVIERAARTGQFDDATYGKALESWAEEEPFAAARLDAQVAMARMAAAQAPVPAPAETLESDKAALAREVDAFKERNPDYPGLVPAINEIAEERPLLKQALNEGSASQRALALQDLYDLAKSRSTATATSQEARRVILRAAQAADKAKSDAAVVGASRTSAAKSDPNPNSKLQSALREMSGLDDLVIE